MLGLHNYFTWFICSEEGYEKPNKEIFDKFYELALVEIPDLKRDEILHIGNNNIYVLVFI